MTIRILLGCGSIIYLVLGTIHLVYTFFTPKFLPFLPAVEAAMKSTSPRLTKQTTMWKAWMGFNASHSTGAMFFGFINLYFAVLAYEVFELSLVLQVITLINSIFYLGLAKVYWFSIPYAGMALSTLCFMVAILLIQLAPL